MSVRLDHGEDSPDELHEINVTPFIDVMLVLLIIFMVAAPLATVDMTLNLPRLDAPSRTDKPLEVWVRADLTVTIGGNPVARDMLGRALLDATNGDKDARILLTADKAVPYGEMLELMNRMYEAGYRAARFSGRFEKLPPL
jgi:biopolymer transport protein ExbD